MLPFNVDDSLFLLQKSLRPERRWAIPYFMVPPYGPEVDEEQRVGQNCVAVDDVVGNRFPHQHWDWRVEVECFFDEGLKVWQIWGVGFLQNSVESDDIGNLFLSFLQHI
ncbi:hypothetical protein C2S51_020360 [Perilla frutescens var. frutescens]|nr:hypothetical protein C2S51_020360 [Perilla frutescens var. frutescens]